MTYPYAFNTSRVFIGPLSYAGLLHLDDSSTATITGGRVDNTFVFKNSTATFSGGDIRELLSRDNGTINILGTGLAENFVRSTPHSIFYRVIGTLLDGAALGADYEVDFDNEFGVNNPSAGTLEFNGAAVTPAPGILTSATFPSSVSGGTVVTATVSIADPSPLDTVVGLSSSDSSVVRVHRAVVVPAGTTTATFPITTYPSSATQTVTIQATLGTVIQTQDLIITGR